MELQDAIRNRRSIRKYQEKDVSDALVEKIVKAGTFAPFAFQRWLAIVVRERKTKEEMLEDFYAQRRNLHVLEAPVDIVVCCDFRENAENAPARRDHGKSDFKLVFGVQETAAMIQNMLLTAHELGLGACWNGSFNDRRVAAVLQLPEDVRPIAIVSLGYPSETPKMPARKSLKSTVYREKFGRTL